MTFSDKKKKTRKPYDDDDDLLGSGVTCLNVLKTLCSMAHHHCTSTHQKVFPRAASLDRYSSTSVLGPTRSRRGNFGFSGSRLRLSFWEFLCGRLTGMVGTGTISPKIFVGVAFSLSLVRSHPRYFGCRHCLESMERSLLVRCSQSSPLPTNHTLALEQTVDDVIFAQTFQDQTPSVSSCKARSTALLLGAL